MSRLLAALKNLQDRGEFDSPPALGLAALPDSATADPHESVGQDDPTHAAEAPRHAAVDRHCEDAVAEDAVAEDAVAEDAVAEDAVAEDAVAENTVSKNAGFNDARPAAGKSGPAPLLPIPPVLDVGLISCSGSPVDDDLYETSPFPSDLHDAPAQPSVTELVDSLLEERLSANEQSPGPCDDVAFVPGSDTDEPDTLIAPDVDGPASLEFGGDAGSLEQARADVPLDNGTAIERAAPVTGEVPEDEVRTLPFQRPDLDESENDTGAPRPTFRSADEASGIGATLEPGVDDPSGRPTVSSHYRLTPQDHKLPMPPVRQHDDPRPRRPVDPESVTDKTRELPAEFPEYDASAGEIASSAVTSASPPPPTQTAALPSDLVDEGAESEPTEMSPAVRRQPVDMTRIADLDSDSRVSEYRGVAARLWLDCQKLQLKSVLLTGIADESHLAEIAASLAVTLSEVEQARVLLVDGDVRDRRLTVAVNQTATPGFAGVFDWESSFIPPAVPTNIPRLEFMPAGQPRCSIRRTEMGLLAEKVRELTRQYDLVLIDGGSLPALPTELLADACDATYPVVRLGRTKSDEALSAVATLRAAGGRIPGCIATDAQRT